MPLTLAQAEEWLQDEALPGWSTVFENEYGGKHDVTNYEAVVTDGQEFYLIAWAASYNYGCDGVSDVIRVYPHTEVKTVTTYLTHPAE